MLSDSDEPPNKPINISCILIGIAVGSLITYILLRKGQTITASSSIPVQNHLDTDINQQIYNRQNELFDQLKLLNELLNRHDELSQQYYQATLQQYQNIPYTLSYTINPELQQIALYLENMNSQLEQTSSRLQEILKQQYQQTNIQQLSRDVQQPSQTTQPHKQGSLLEYIHQRLQVDNSQQQSLTRKQTQQSQDDIYTQQQTQTQQKDNLQASDTSHKNSDMAYKNKEQWAIKRGSDGRIRSLEIIRNALTKKQ